MKIKTFTPYLLKAFKIAGGALISIAIASFFKLDNYLSAGIVTVLTLQETKKETFLLAAKRLLAFIVTICFAYICFTVMGFSVISFAVYLFVFSLFCLFLKMPQNIAVCAVLAGHFLLAESVALSLIINQFFIMVIGVGIAILLNLFISSRINKVIERQDAIDGFFRQNLIWLADVLDSSADVVSPPLSLSLQEKSFDKALPQARMLSDNSLLSNQTYYLQYFTLRKTQFDIFKSILLYLPQIDFSAPESKILADFVRSIASQFHECNDATALLEEDASLRQIFRDRELPKTRAEFETRAVLFRLLSDIKSFLLLKKSFVDSLSEEQLLQFANHCKLPVSRLEN
ncbi:MAG: aromatic acid exporter family protein [Oscillospiraceae bacterium]